MPAPYIFQAAQELSVILPVPFLHLKDSGPFNSNTLSCSHKYHNSVGCCQWNGDKHRYMYCKCCLLYKHNQKGIRYHNYYRNMD